jgi:N utilization substance protein B
VQNWTLGRLSGVARAVLRLGAAELMGIPESPARVILNESVRLAMRYGEEDAGSFVNGVLDALARRVRPEEMAREGRSG